MRKFVVVAIAGVFLAGCAPKFEIIDSAGDQFEKQDRVISTRGNRLGCELGAFSGQKDGLLFDYAFNV
ncbi:MAG: hypothetical protein LBE89_04405, partial [Helicobacteraceae bacterium]|nr:hypothetical protein [Helicobacteraceae bacterium]